MKPQSSNQQATQTPQTPPSLRAQTIAVDHRAKLLKLLSDSKVTPVFSQFLEQSYCSENLLFWYECVYTCCTSDVCL